MLLGLTGLAGSGKTTVAEMLECHKYVQVAFADTLKSAAAVIFNMDIEHFYDQGLKEIVNPFWGMSPRTMLQKLGTDACRNGISQDIWIKSMQASCAELLNMGENLVITDVRFENEADLVRDLGGVVVHVVSNRESNLASTNQAHTSESGVAFDARDAVINNCGTLEQLKQKVSLFSTKKGTFNA